MDDTKKTKRFTLFKKTSSSGETTSYGIENGIPSDTPSVDTEKAHIEQRPLQEHQKPGFFQQDNHVKQFYLDIGDKGLRYAWAKYFLTDKNPTKFSRTKTDSPKHIIIVGAGFAGLSAAFELEQVGHETTILELQYRVGGRAKTIRHGFSEGLHSEDWFKNNLTYLEEFYPEAARYVKKHGLESIEKLYQRTIDPVIKDLENNSSQDGWRKWIERWSKYSVESFLLDDKEVNQEGLRPWPEDAIQAYKVTTYSPFMNRSLVEILRDELGHWWSKTMWTPKAGMQSFAERFTDQSVGWNKTVFLSKNIQFGKRVETLKINNNRVTVHGRNTSTGHEFVFEGDAVIVTTTLPILRQMTIQDETGNKNFLNIRRVISDIHNEASTKIFLQCRSRFWEKDLGNGGFSKTNLPIGQVHYPSKEDIVPNSNRGILMCYSWGEDAIMLGAQPEQVAIASAVRQVKNIHPEIEEEFEVGRMQAWTRDESAQLAFTLLNPNQYQYALETLLTTDTHPLHIAGEALSWSNGWIEGALESGLKAAYDIFCKYEKPIPT